MMRPPNKPIARQATAIRTMIDLRVNMPAILAQSNRDPVFAFRVGDHKVPWQITPIFFHHQTAVTRL